MDCRACRQAQEAGIRPRRCGGIDQVGECPTGEVPRLLEANRLIWWFFQRIIPGVFDGNRTVKPDFILKAMELYGVPRGERPVVYEMCLALIAGIRECWDAEQKSS